MLLYIELYNIFTPRIKGSHQYIYKLCIASFLIPVPMLEIKIKIIACKLGTLVAIQIAINDDKKFEVENIN